MRVKLLTLLLVLSVASQAQPILSSACNPLAGDSHQQFFTDTFLQGPAGAGITWHFDTLHDYGSDTVYMSSCSASLDCSYFRGSDVYEHYSDNAISIFYSTAGSALTENGYYYSTAIPYSNPETILRYPFTYGYSFTDTFSGGFILSSYGYGRLGYVTVTADAYGTLILPNAVYPNALRVHFYETYTDSGNTGGTPYSYSYTQNSYVWYVPGARTEVLEIARTTGPSGLTINSYYTSPQPDALPPLTKQQNDITLYPNPATGQVTISTHEPFKSGSRVAIYDITGRLCGKYPLEGASNVIPTNQFAPGTYVCRLFNTEGGVASKMLVIAK